MAENETSALDEQRIAIIGCGNMGGALLRGLVRSGGISPSNITISDVDTARIEQLASELGVAANGEIAKAVEGATVILLAVKPGVVGAVLSTLPNLRTGYPSPLLISVAAGVRLEQIETFAGAPLRVVRAMPNLACEVGEGISCLYGRDPDEVSQAEGLFSLMGSTLLLHQENDLDSVTGLSGSGPAFVALFVEALADGGVRIGLPRDIATRLATETARGAAALMLQKGLTPSELKNRVASPGGTTIAGLHELEKGAVRGSIMSAIEAAAKRSAAQGKASS